MKHTFKLFCSYCAILLLLLAVTSCEHERKEAIDYYHNLVNKAELAICEEDFRAALDNYGLAFRKIDRPFAADLYNASLAAQASAYWAERDQYLCENPYQTDAIMEVHVNFHERDRAAMPTK